MGHGSLAMNLIAIRHVPTLAFVDSWARVFDRGSGSECRVESGRLVSDRIVRVLGD